MTTCLVNPFLALRVVHLFYDWWFIRAGASWYFLEKLGWLTVNMQITSSMWCINVPPRRHLWLFCLCTKEAPVKENGKRRENKVNNANKSDSGRSESRRHTRTNERVQKCSQKFNKKKWNKSRETRERHHRRRKVEMEKETGKKSTKKRRIIIIYSRREKKRRLNEILFKMTREPWLGDASKGGGALPALFERMLAHCRE